MERLSWIFKKVAKKRKLEPNLNVFDRRAEFLYLLSREAYDANSTETADHIYLCLRQYFSVDIPPKYCKIKFLHLQHANGVVLGQAEYSEFLTVYQGVTVGVNTRGYIPTIGSYVTLFPNSQVIGRSVIGDHSVVGASVQIFDAMIPCHSSVRPKTQSKTLNHPEYIPKSVWYE